MNHAQPRGALRQGVEYPPGLIAAAVVDGDNLKSRVFLIHQKLDRLLHVRSFVVARNDNRNGRRFGQRRHILHAVLRTGFPMPEIKESADHPKIGHKERVIKKKLIEY
ncbi:MAG: hypothetical protein MPW14_05445 [Candidatus Manganitrophus sp.]|nr:MAG: hypothetical protein MPW14_05445 [Candidatus Manganitrophus sp.]